nr:uncharacterized protein LOC111414485 [Onthophagus taurus]
MYMSDSPFLYPLIVIATILGTLQGLTWMIISFLVIILYAETWIPDKDSMGYFNNGAYFLLFESQFNPPVEDLTNLQSITGFVIVFACFYFVLSLLWTINSLALAHRYFWKLSINISQIIRLWSFLAFIITIYDLVTMSVLAYDLGVIQNSTQIDDATKFLFSTVMGVAMTIAGRGYILLAINLIVAFILPRAL